MKKFSYDDLINGKLEFSFTDDEQPLEIKSLDDFKRTDKTLLLEIAKNYINDDGEIYAFDFLNYEMYIFWYWVLHYTNLSDIIDFQLEELEPLELAELMDVAVSTFFSYHPCDTFFDLVREQMNQVVSSMNLKRFLVADNDLAEMASMYEELRKIQESVVEGANVLGEFNSVLKGE